MPSEEPIVFAESEEKLVRLYSEFVNSDVLKKYPKYVGTYWSRRKKWAVCYRQHLLVRGNHTNNYAGAGFRILNLQSCTDVFVC